MIRSQAEEILDGDGVAPHLVERAHRELMGLNRFLGNTEAILAALSADSLPVRRVLDVGCGYGGILREVQSRMGVDVIGVDLRPPEPSSVPFPVLRANAVSDPLPEADVAISTLMGHHVTSPDLAAMIVNVGRSCRRFVLLDLVRSRIPLIMFRVFVAPFLSPISVADGCTSIRRAYTPDELGELTRDALAGTGATFRQSVTPLRSRQMLDIRYR